MAIDLCIEGTGWVIYALDGGASDMMTTLRRLLPFANRQPMVDTSLDQANQTRRAAAQLPIDEARAIWLVDVCGYSYDTAATATGADHQTVADRVSSGRQAIRRQVYGEPTQCIGDR